MSKFMEAFESTKEFSSDMGWDINYIELYKTIKIYHPQDYNDIVLITIYSTDASSFIMKLYVRKSASGKFTDAEKKLIDTRTYINMVLALDKIIAPTLKRVDDKNRWTVGVFRFGKPDKTSGNLNCSSNFEYDDHSEDSLEYMRKLEKKYLK